MSPHPKNNFEVHLGLPPGGGHEALFRVLIELGSQFVGADEGSLLLLDEKKESLVFVMTVGNLESEKTLAGQKVPVGKGITGLAAKTHEVQIGNPIYRDVRQSRMRSDQEGAPNEVLAAPMLIEDELIGVVTAVSFDPSKRFTGEHAKLYGRVAAVLGVVVDQTRRLAEHAIRGRRKDAKGSPDWDTALERLRHELGRASPEKQSLVTRLLTDLLALLHA